MRMQQVELCSGNGSPKQERLRGRDLSLLLGGPGLRTVMVEELELLRKTEQTPAESTHPRGEGRVALLRAGTSERAVVQIEDAFLGGASGLIVNVAPLPIINAELSGSQRV